MKKKKSYNIWTKIALLIILLSISFSVEAQPKAVYFVNDMFVTEKNITDSILPEEIESIEVIKKPNGDLRIDSLFQKYGEDSGFIFIRLKTGLDLLSPDGKRLESERIPVFPGGRKAISDYIEKNKMVYPDSLRRLGIEWKDVYVNFVIKPDGALTDIKVREEGIPELDVEAVRLVREMPRWVPGKKKGLLSDYNWTLCVDFGKDPRPRVFIR